LRLTRRLLFLIVLMATFPAVAQAPYWQCAAFARQFSGIDIRGDAWTWWSLADGRYAKGKRPRIGAVLSFMPSDNMRLGHVATVTQVLGDREITVTHANWSPISGTRGQIERAAPPLIGQGRVAGCGQGIEPARPGRVLDVG
jgi:surface antigen